MTGLAEASAGRRDLATDVHGTLGERPQPRWQAAHVGRRDVTGIRHSLMLSTARRDAAARAAIMVG
jgi:hypothetical protein